VRSYKTVILEAELLASPPAVVAEFLKKRAAQSKDERRDDDVDEELETALNGRNDPLINLALARYGQFNAAVLPLFKGCKPSSVIHWRCWPTRHWVKSSSRSSRSRCSAVLKKPPFG
jgi:hypothetical protein